MNNYNYKVPCSKDKLKEIRVFVSKTLSKYGLDEVEVSTLVLAIDEVCANLIIHSHNCNPQEFIEVNVLVERGKGVTFQITDTGKGFDINDYQEPTIDELIKKQRKGGIGLILVKKIMDRIEFKTSSKKNTCRLFKKINVI